MADGINRVTLLGNLVRDGELRATSGGQQVLKFTVACSQSYQDRDGQRKEKTEFIGCTLWGKRAEALSKYLTKGQKVCVEGSIHTSSYEKNGEKRYSTEVNASNIVLCGGGERGGERRPSDQSSHDRQKSNGFAPDGGSIDDADYGDDPNDPNPMPF